LEVEAFIALKKVEGFCFLFWRLKVLVIALKDLKEDDGFYFWSSRLKVLVIVFREVEGFCFCS
jgi:hypothetical protein